MYRCCPPPPHVKTRFQKLQELPWCFEKIPSHDPPAGLPRRADAALLAFFLWLFFLWSEEDGEGTRQCHIGNVYGTYDFFAEVPWVA